LEEKDFDFSAQRVTASVHESLGRLGLEYLDIVQAHDVEFGSLDQARLLLQLRGCHACPPSAPLLCARCQYVAPVLSCCAMLIPPSCHRWENVIFPLYIGRWPALFLLHV
jgi:hypothetical protein